jgi:sulfatase maturation enzyme AslB (radical SAM superfamily)
MGPDHLAVYLSNSCNLACSYCYVSVNQGRPVSLSYEDLKKSVDFFLEKVESPSKKITFLGGEPFLNWPLFQSIARHARRAGGKDLVLQTFTNGTLLTPEKLAFLEEQDVHATISLDGRKSANDKHRVYFKAAERSVFDDVMARLADLPKENLGVSLVFTSETIDELLPNIDFFYRMGFGRITFNPELYELWSDDRLDVMRAQLRAFRKFYKLALEKGRPFQIPILYAVLANAQSNKRGVRWWHDCHNVVLGPDAHYYACDKALTFPIGKAEDQRVGTVEKGMKWEPRREHFDRAIAGIEKAGYGKDEYFCPMGVYFYSEEAGREPTELLGNFEKVAATFSEGLLGLVEDLESNPVFQDLYVNARVV